MADQSGRGLLILLNMLAGVLFIIVSYRLYNRDDFAGTVLCTVAGVIYLLLSYHYSRKK